jgi:hypothetical protein
MIVDWLKDRLDGRPFDPQKIYIRMSGKEAHTAW